MSKCIKRQKTKSFFVFFVGVPEREKERAEIIFEEIMVENFPNVIKDMNYRKFPLWLSSNEPD